MKAAVSTAVTSVHEDHPNPAPAKTTRSPVYCLFDVVDLAGLHGWAFDQERPSDPVVLRVIVDGTEIGQMRCDHPRPDVAAAGAGPELVGMKFPLPDALLDGRVHRLALRDIADRPVRMMSGGELRETITFAVAWTPEVRASIDGLKRGGLEGWVLRSERGSEALRGDCMLRFSWNDTTIGYTRANRFRSDVAMAMNTGPHCGFRFVLPPALRRPGHMQIRAYLMPENVELQGSPVTVRIADSDEEERLLELIQTVDKLEREAARLRRSIRDLLPRPSYGLDQYDEWFRLYMADLRARVARERRQAGGPLVSVVCPVYRPDPVHFTAAVESVRAQTYANWELILVDDCSREPALTALMDRLAASDRRIKVLRHRQNGGISEATNTAIAAAGGAWIALFDHDDMLVDVALEVMAGAIRPDTALLYSDEDKIDDTGLHSEPAFKPEWNHRYMLSANFICHLAMIRRDVLAAVGPLRKAYDGAQDHDLFLRVSERVDGAAIQHVPEVLYHWRKTTRSTAAAGGNKPYARRAGAKAVSDHLARMGRPATVTPIGETTMYRHEWRMEAEPEVTIIIPFKDHVDITSRCLEAVRGTDYPNFRVTLIDNWSTSREAARFVAAATADPRVRVMRIEEEFNFSRLNNLAARQAGGDYYVFMNNDLLVTSPGWLRAALGEALSDPRVGAVGGKFVYPSGLVQHAGVVLGAGGIAGHSFVGLPPEDGGYCGRAIVAQELSAVTAAGMLVRAEAFHRIGGFDEVAFSVAFNDVDLCLRLRKAGYITVMTPAFCGEHHESLSRGHDEQPLSETRFFLEIEAMRERWGPLLERDPMYSRFFAPSAQTYVDLVPPTVGKPEPAWVWPAPERHEAPAADPAHLAAPTRAAAPARPVKPKKRRADGGS